MKSIEPSAKPPAIWTNIVLFSLTAAAALILVPWYGHVHGFSTHAWVLMGALLAANELSITAGYHRLWSHRAYEAYWPVRVLFLIFGTMALQNSVFAWCSGHRRHHLHVDDVDRDPYSAKRGLWFSHIGWMLRRYPSGETNFNNIPDLVKDPLLKFQHTYYLPLVLVLNIGLPFLIGVLTGDVWGVVLLAGLLRLVLSHHLTFFINSLAHKWGSRPYTEANTARDNPVLAVLTFGEGYHNFHHLFAHDYRNGVRWWQWDPTKWLIRSLAFLGLAHKLKRTPDFQIQKAALLVQFSKAQEALERAASRSAPAYIEDLKARLSGEYDRFTATVNAWVKTKEAWVSEKRQAVSAQFETSYFQSQLKALERALQEQRFRLQALQFSLA